LGDAAVAAGRGCPRSGVDRNDLVVNFGVVAGRKAPRSMTMSIPAAPSSTARLGE
jgi:hypothetical protein